MQRNTKLTLIVTLIILAFVFIFIFIVYQYFMLAELQKQLQERTAELSWYNKEYNLTMQQIQEVQSPSYIERWARSVLGWSGEGEIRIII